MQKKIKKSRHTNIKDVVLNHISIPQSKNILLNVNVKKNKQINEWH